MYQTLSKDIYTETLPDGTSFELIRIEGGSFRMGNDDESAYRWEKPAHLVHAPSFHLGKYPVTQALWESVMGENPSYFKGSNRPVEQVSWDDVQIFIEKLNKITKRNYRLPSEVEWEYAARGGKQSKGFQFSGGNKLKEVGWYRENSHDETKPVGLKLPNELGLYDMSGNVREWCADAWHENYEGAPEDGSVWTTGGDQARRVVRGGSWSSLDDSCRVSNRYFSLADIRSYYRGFRLAGY
ncbi:MAG: formylglycine-generating enzyme family protein [Saprospiraceae bacterium]|nr:formylglycine-generating enzyme family protein [Saprospiraceae bacterium]